MVSKNHKRHATSDCIVTLSIFNNGCNNFYLSQINFTSLFPTFQVSKHTERQQLEFVCSIRKGPVTYNWLISLLGIPDSNYKHCMVSL